MSCASRLVQVGPSYTTMHSSYSVVDVRGVSGSLTACSVGAEVGIAAYVDAPLTSLMLNTSA